jgi:hypothetical protein
MAEEPNELTDRIERQRESISATVDEIENRISPSRIAARRTYRMKRTVVDWKDRLMGNDEPDYPWNRSMASSGMYQGYESEHHGLRETAQHAPEAIRRQTQGNPFAAGVIALGAGWLTASLLPETRSERRVMQKIQPGLESAARTVRDEASELAGELREPAKQAVGEVTERGREAGEQLAADTRSAAQKNPT